MPNVSPFSGDAKQLNELIVDQFDLYNRLQYPENDAYYTHNVTKMAYLINDVDVAASRVSATIMSTGKILVFCFYKTILCYYNKIVPL